MKTFVVLIGLVAAAYARVLPNVLYENPCDQNADDYDDCLLDKIQKIYPLIVKGNRDAGIPSLEPLSLPYMAVDGQSEGISIKMILRNTTISGHGEAKITKLRYDPSTMAVDLSYNIPSARLQTEFYANGRLFVIPLGSNSLFDGNFTDCDLSMRFTLKRAERKGIEILQVDKMLFKGRVETARVNITSVDPEFQTPVTILQNFFNTNDRLVLDTVNPIFRYYGSDIFKSLFNHILQNIPAGDLIPRA